MPDIATLNPPVTDVVTPCYDPVIDVIAHDDFTKEALRLRQEGLSYADIAQQLKTNKMRVKRACDSVVTKIADKFDNSLRPVYKQTISERLKEIAPQALSQIEKLSNHARRESVKYQASADIMDRAGYKPVERSLNINAIEEMNAPDINKLVASILGNQGINIPIETESQLESEALKVVTTTVASEVITTNEASATIDSLTTNEINTLPSTSVANALNTGETVCTVEGGGVEVAVRYNTSPSHSSPNNVPVRNHQKLVISVGTLADLFPRIQIEEVESSQAPAKNVSGVPQTENEPIDKLKEVTQQ